MKLTVISIVSGALGTISEGLLKGMEDLKIRRQEETIQTTALSRSVRIAGDLRKLAVTPTPGKNHITNAGVKNYQRSKMIIVIRNFNLKSYNCSQNK